jgi:hypothetical protein
MFAPNFEKEILYFEKAECFHTLPFFLIFAQICKSLFAFRGF